MSKLQQLLVSKEIGSGSSGDPVSVQSEATLDHQPFDQGRFKKVLEELEAPFASIVKTLESDIACSCSCRLGLIVGLEDGSVVLVGYDAVVRVLGKHGGKVYDLCANKDVVVSASLDTTLCIWSLAEQRQLFPPLKGHTSYVYCVALSFDGKYIVSGSDDKAVRVWDAKAGKHLFLLNGHTDYVWRVSISSDGKYIVSGSNDKTVRIWSFEEKKPLDTFGGHSNRVDSVLISSDGKYVISKSNETVMRIWSFERRQLSVFEGHKYNVSCVSTLSDGKIVSGSVDHTMRIWSLEEKKLLAVLEGHSANVNCVSISTDGKRMVSGSDDKTLRIWDIEDRKQVAVLEGHTAGVYHVSISPAGKQVISISRDKMVRVWNLETEQQFEVLEGHAKDIASILSNGKHIVSGSYDMTVRVWDIEQRNQPTVLEGHTGWVYCLSISADGKQIASASADKTVRIWNLETGGKPEVLEHPSPVYCVAISFDGKHIVSGCADCTVQIWDFERREKLEVLKGHTNLVWCVSISLDGKYIVSGSWDNTLLIWGFESRTQLAVLEGHTNNLRCVSISSDGKHILSASDDKTVRIWSMEDRRQLFALEGHTSNVRCVTMTSDGKHVISASEDKTVRIWDFDERKLIAVLEGHSDAVLCIAITTDGKQVLSGSKDKTIRITDLTMVLPTLKSDFLRVTFDNKEPSPSKTYYFSGKFQEILKEGIPIASCVASSPILPHYFNSLHICAYHNQFTALKDYLEKGVPIIRGVFGSPLTVAITKNSTKCINAILQPLISKFEMNQGFLVLQEIVEDFPKLLVCNASSLVPFFSTLLGTPTQSLPEYIVPLRELPCALFQPQQLINISDFAQFEGTELFTQNGELVKFLISRFNWNFALGSAESLEFLRALEDCEDRRILTTPLVNSLIQFKWNTLLLVTRTHTLLYVCSLLCLVGLTCKYLNSDVLSLIFLFLNVLFLSYEIVQILANGNHHWRDPWNYVDLIRCLSSVTWGSLLFSGIEQLDYLQFLVVSVGFLRGFTFFRTFKLTRMFVRMVVEVVKEMRAFLVVLAYSTISFGMMAVALLPEPIGGAPSAWTTAYQLLMGQFETKDFDLLQWLCFTAASLMNVIIMLNLLISILGAAYQKAQESASEHDNLEMLKLVIEYESMLFWRWELKEPSVLVVCKSAEEEDAECDLAAQIKTIKQVVEKNLKDTELLRVNLEEKLEKTRTTLEAKIDQVLAALKAPR